MEENVCLQHDFYFSFCRKISTQGNETEETIG